MPTKRWNVKSGFREDLGVRVRSGWEASVLRWLNYQGLKWEYEPKRFPFPIKRGTISYTPDIWVPKKKLWIEVKGSISTTDRTRIKRFQKYYPEEFARLVAIPGSAKTEAARFFEEVGVPHYAYFLELNKEFRDLIPKWND